MILVLYFSLLPPPFSIAFLLFLTTCASLVLELSSAIGRTRDRGWLIRDVERSCNVELCSGELSLGTLGAFVIVCVDFRFFVDTSTGARIGE